MEFHAAVARLHPDGSLSHGPGRWSVAFNFVHGNPFLTVCFIRYAEKRLARAQALKGMMLDAAYASFAENEIGSLTPDFVILNGDVMAVPFEEILGTKVSATGRYKVAHLLENAHARVLQW